MYTVSKIMKLIKGNFARKYNEYKKREGTVWSQSFEAKIIENETEFKERLDYIHSLPVVKELTTEPGSYEFSSYNNYSRAKFPLINFIIFDTVYILPG
ncbi:hypothetical protein ES703_84474 [subsurface metagenome]